jgi:glycosyltransferase involved in cell wall biosynthesis
MRLLAKQLGIDDSRIISNSLLRARSTSLLRAILFQGEIAARLLTRRQIQTVAARWLIPKFAALDCDIVHCHDALSTWSAVVARRKARARYKIVSTVHGPVSRHLQEQSKLSADDPGVRAVERCEREAWTESEAIIAVDTTQSQIIQEQGADPKKITVIANAVDVREVDEICAALPLRRNEDRPWIVLARRLEPKNGVEFAIRAIAEFSSAELRPRLILAGDGAERPRLIEMATQLGVENDVVFLGAVQHSALLPLVRAADIVLIPSVPEQGVVEATSIAAIEAMAMRRPVVASGIGGLLELMTDGVSGILVQPRDPSAIANAVRRVLASPDLARTLGEGAREIVLKRFSVEPWFNAIRKVYDSVLGPVGQKFLSAVESAASGGIPATRADSNPLGLT